MKTKPKSNILAAMHESAADMYQIGIIDKRRMQEFDVLCLSTVPDYDAAAVRALRERYRLSQTVLAAVLNTSASTVRQWESGTKHPSGSASKLLQILDRKGPEGLAC